MSLLPAQQVLLFLPFKAMLPRFLANNSLVNLPKRELLSFLVVLALPIASIIGLLARTFRSMFVSDSLPPTAAKYRMAYLALTVFPAPDSPDTMMLRLHFWRSSFVYASSAIAKMCGSSSPSE